MNAYDGGKKWTYHRGRVLQVDMRKDSGGVYTGYHYHGDGVSWVNGTKELPADYYWDTKEEAVEGMKKKFLKKLEDNRTVMEFLTACLERNKEDAVSYQKRLEELDQEEGKE